MVYHECSEGILPKSPWNWLWLTFKIINVIFINKAIEFGKLLDFQNSMSNNLVCYQAKNQADWICIFSPHICSRAYKLLWEYNW